MKVSEVNAGKHHNVSLTTLFACHMGRLKTTKIGECHEFFGSYSCVACATTVVLCRKYKLISYI